MTDDKDAFLEAMSDVTPLPAPNRADSKKKRAPAVPRQTEADERRVLRSLDRPFDDPAVLSALETGEELIYRRDEVSHRILRRLRRGQYSVADSLDLHHMDVATATSSLSRFIDLSCERGHGCIRIVHGKGLRSRGVPKLKRLTDRMLRRNKAVLAFASCRPVDGGTGAVYVLLRSRRSGR